MEIRMLAASFSWHYVSRENRAEQLTAPGHSDAELGFWAIKD
jgi:hypothetical protein